MSLYITSFFFFETLNWLWCVFFFFFFFVIVFFLERDLENGCVDKRTLLCLFLPREKERERERKKRAVLLFLLFLFLFF